MEGGRSLSIGGFCLLRAGGWRGLVSQEGDGWPLRVMRWAVV